MRMEEYRIGTKENPRHILGLSGGKDSTALAVHIKNTRPEIFEKLELFFTDTGVELEEIYEYLDRLEKYLGKKIHMIKASIGENNEFDYKDVDKDDESNPFDEYLYDRFNGYMPSVKARWCTRFLKIEPMRKWIGDDYCISYVGIRADEPDRDGFNQDGKSKRKKVDNIIPQYPFREDGLTINDIYRLLDESIGVPLYYKWRTRSGCYFCFFQRRVEYALLYKLHPDLFKEAKKYEEEHEDGRTYYWIKDKSLDYIEKDYKSIIIRYIKKQHKKASDEYKKQFTMTLEEMIKMVEDDKILEFVDSWEMKRLHDVDGENKDGCTVCAV